jgi:hypothetical protein
VERSEVEASGLRVAILRLFLLLLRRFGVVVVMAVRVREVHRGCLRDAGPAEV